MKYLKYIIFFSLAFSEYLIDESKSKVMYYGNHPLHSWVGKTSSIMIKSECKSNKKLNCNFEFRIPFMSFYSGNDNRDSNMLYNVNAFLHPDIIMTFNDFIIRELNNIYIKGKLSINGILREIEIPLNIYAISENRYSIQSFFSISLDEFNIKTPKLLFLSIDNDIKIEVSLLVNKI